MSLSLTHPMGPKSSNCTETQVRKDPFTLLYVTKLCGMYGISHLIVHFQKLNKNNPERSISKGLFTLYWVYSILYWYVAAWTAFDVL